MQVLGTYTEKETTMHIYQNYNLPCNYNNQEDKSTQNSRKHDRKRHSNRAATYMCLRSRDMHPSSMYQIMFLGLNSYLGERGCHGRQTRIKRETTLFRVWRGYNNFSRPIPGQTQSLGPKNELNVFDFMIYKYETKTRENGEGSAK